MSDLVENRAWNRMPHETDSAWAAFTMYLDMPVASPDRKERRSINNLKTKLNHASATTIAGWSNKYQWVARARAFDMFMGVKVEEMRLAGIEDMQRAVLQTASKQIALLNSLIDRQLESMSSRQEEGNEVRPLELKQLTDVIKLKDDVMRRIASMPTEFKYQRVDNKDIVEDDVVYVLGGMEDA